MFKKSYKFKVPVLIPGLLLVAISLIFLMFFSSCNAALPGNGSAQNINEPGNKITETQTGRENKSNQRGLPKVLAVESFLADITKNISGSRLEIETLMPLGLDPHSFEPSPGDVAKIAESDILIINGSGFEEWLNDIITGANEKIIIVECSKGLKNRIQDEGGQVNSSKQGAQVAESAIEGVQGTDAVSESVQEQGSNKSGQEAAAENETGYRHEGDPHFWLDPNLVMVYVQNIKDALIESDPQGKDLYNKNAADYTARLRELDTWIKEEVKIIPPDERLLVTNHESFGYYADRYGFKVIGTIIPNFSSASSPSAKEVSSLIEKIKAANVRAIFLETGSDSKIADQIAKETGITVVTELLTHSITEPGGPAPSYIEMIEFDTKMIVESLK
jgi:ABC-type Zn uptake system ZnuABC Zn-binding protein ZnuA